jgi:hypothetical protein
MSDSARQRHIGPDCPVRRSVIPEGVCDRDDQAPRFLIHDRDSIYGIKFRRRVKGLGARCLVTPPESPEANSFCESQLASSPAMEEFHVVHALHAVLAARRMSDRVVPNVRNTGSTEAKEAALPARRDEGA